nr:ATP-binding cassette domain-containing protein [Rhodoferax sp.]
MTNAVSSQPPVVLRVEGLGFGHSKQAVLFKDFAVSLSPGVTWLGGDESTGKTTLLRLLAGELTACSGTLAVNDIQLHSQVQAYRNQVFWVDPRTQAFDALTPQAYWGSVRKQYPAFADGVLSELIEAFGLEAHLPKSLYMLSTGTKRKVFFAAAFASGSAVTLLDEPFAALDRASVDAMLELLREASVHSSRAWVVADYVAPRGVALASTIVLGGVNLVSLTRPRA